ncbi:MAG: carbohydrate ABC transporter permease, partial [Brachybacterium sp.]|nr:carbohydrate ABC transporter permease [Brachybacterium sp.]
PPSRRRRSRGSPASRAERNPLRMVLVGLLWVAVALGIALLFWIIVQSLRDTRSILAEPFGMPTSLEFENWSRAWTVGDFGRAAWNSAWVTLVSSALTVVVAAPAAYYLGRVDTPVTRFLSNYFVLGLGIPAQVIMIPLFVMLSRLYLTNSLIGLNLVYIGISMPFTVFLLISFFRTLPEELEEAAAIDGTSPLGTMVRIIMPLAKGGIMTAFILQVISHWNETLMAMTLLSSTDKYTLPVALIGFVQQQTYSGADWGGLFAGICIVVLPMLIMFLFVSRRLTEGLTVGMGK